MSAHTATYRARLSSTAWRQLRAERNAQTGGRCERCGRRCKRLELHHRTYDTLGQEQHDDVELLCRSCHRWADHQRRRDLEWKLR